MLKTCYVCHNSCLFVVMCACAVCIKVCDWWCLFGVDRAVFLDDWSAFGAIISLATCHARMADFVVCDVLCVLGGYQISASGLSQLNMKVSVFDVRFHLFSTF